MACTPVRIIAAIRAYKVVVSTDWLQVSYKRPGLGTNVLTLTDAAPMLSGGDLMQPLFAQLTVGPRDRVTDLTAKRSVSVSHPRITGPESGLERFQVAFPVWLATAK